MLRLQEAERLLETSQWCGAYYLAGYVVECSIKAAICSRVTPFSLPPNKKAWETLFSHDLQALLDMAGLSVDLFRSSASLQANWATVKDWSEQSRYQIVDEVDAKQIHSAITNPEGGVLEWLKTFW